MEIRRGDILYIEKRNDTVGHEQWSGRPGIVVSNDTINRAESTVEIVYMTTQPKKQSPLHIPIFAMGRTSTALCEQIWTISTERVQNKGENIGDQIRKIDRALMVSLGLDGKSKEKEKPWNELSVDEAFARARRNINAAADAAEKSSIEDMAKTMQDIRESKPWKAKYEVLRELYDSLVDRVVG